MNIFKEAKKIQRKHPSFDWQRCIQMASHKHKPAKHRVVHKRKTVTHKPKRHAVIKTVRPLHGTLAEHLAGARAILKSKLAFYLVSRDLAKGKRAKHKWTKHIREARKQLNKLNK